MSGHLGNKLWKFSVDAQELFPGEDVNFGQILDNIGFQKWKTYASETL